MVVTTVPLGRSEVEVTPLAFGTWAWGDAGYWGYGTRHGPAEAVDAFVAALDGGVRFFDSAEVYGHGESERVLGALARRAGAPLVLATKFAPLAGRGGRAGRSRGRWRAACGASGCAASTSTWRTGPTARRRPSRRSWGRSPGPCSGASSAPWA
jgi:aryl-alcohol dehydrogenase-like predicted oxidoreductase